MALLASALWSWGGASLWTQDTLGWRRNSSSSLGCCSSFTGGFPSCLTLAVPRCTPQGQCAPSSHPSSGIRCSIPVGCPSVAPTPAFASSAPCARRQRRHMASISQPSDGGQWRFRWALGSLSHHFCPYFTVLWFSLNLFCAWWGERSMNAWQAAVLHITPQEWDFCEERALQWSWFLHICSGNAGIFSLSSPLAYSTFQFTSGHTGNNVLWNTVWVIQKQSGQLGMTKLQSLKATEVFLLKAAGCSFSFCCFGL